MTGTGPNLLAALTTTDLVLVVLPVTLALLAVIALAGLYNTLAVARVRMRNALSQIDVQLRRRHDLAADIARGARYVLDHDRLAELGCQSLADESADHVGTAGRRVGHDHADLLVGPRRQGSTRQ